MPRALVRYAALAAGCCAIGTGSIFIYGVRDGLGAFTREFRWLPPLDMWIRWDARWYEMIATQGYFFSPTDQSSIAFFPLYPLLMRVLGWLHVHPFVAGVLITVASGATALVLFDRWAKQVAGERAASGATWLLLLWPFAYYLYGAVYSDALFLVLIVGAFLSLERGNVPLAVLLGILATATRPITPAVVIGLLARQLELRRRAGKPLRVIDFLPALAGLGLAAFMAWQWVKFGTPFAFVETQAGWQQNPGPHVWFKLDFFRSPRFAQKAPQAFLHAVLAFGFLALAVPTWRRLGRGYGLYVALAVGIPLVSSTEFIGLGRYLLAVFPCFLTLFLVAENRPRALRGWLLASAVLLVIMTSRFAVGRHVS